MSGVIVAEHRRKAVSKMREAKAMKNFLCGSQYLKLSPITDG